MNRRQVQPEQSHKGASREQIERAGVATNELVEIGGYRAVILPNRERGGFTGLFFDLAGVIDFHGQDMDSAERDGAETLRVLLEYCTKEGKEHRRATPLDWSDLEIPYNQSWDEEEKIRRREHQRGSLLGCLRARLWKIPPPPPDDDLHPVLVGMLRSGAKEPDYSRHIIHYQNGKMVSDGETNAVTPYQHSQGFAELELTPEDRAGNLAVVKTLRKAEDRAARERAGGSKGGSASNLTGYDKALHLASKIRKSEPRISTRDLADRIKAEGGSRVTAEAETLRKKIATWEKEERIQKSTATPGRKPKRSQKNK